MMTQQVMIRTESDSAIKPLVKAAIRNELKVLQHGLQRTRQRLDDFEKCYQMTSAEFQQRLASRELDDTLDFIDWNMEIQAYRLLEDQYQALSEASID